METDMQRPFTFLNMAMTADGKIATANREVISFGSPRDLAHLYELRSTADAILCGANTLRETGATLGNGDEIHRRRRLARGLSSHPIRVVVTGSGTLSSNLPLWKGQPSPVVVLTTEKAGEADRKRLESLASQVWVSQGTEVDFVSALARLHRDHGVRRLLGEGGATVNDALFRNGLVDELHLTLCPYLVGGKRAPTLVDGLGFERLADSRRLKLVRKTRKQDELFLVYRVIQADTLPPTE